MKIILLTDQFIHSGDTFIVGGWIQSLITILQQTEKLEIAVAGLTPLPSSVEKIQETLYYRINDRVSRNPLQRIWKKWQYAIQNQQVIEEYIKAIQTFNPDIVHIFGVENFLCRVIPYLKYPVIVHLQGLVNPYLNAWFPPGISPCNYFYHSFNLHLFLRGMGQIHQYKAFQRAAWREIEYFRHIRFCMGRTAWDRQIAHSLSPNCRYFHIEEVLRPDFYTTRQWVVQNRTKFQLLSVLSPASYKGFDLILKTAKYLKLKGLNFQWQICGTSEKDIIVQTMEKISKKKFKENDVVFLGKKTASELITLLLNSDLLIHPSYIDNSPNSICEAQILGIPVIATNVGGIPSLIEHGVTGILVSANDIYAFSDWIQSLLSDTEKRQSLGINARTTALQRHDRKAILMKLETVYDEIKNEP